MTERTFTHVRVHPPDADRGDHDDGCWSCTWSVIGDLRAPGTGYSDYANHAAREELADQYPHVEFDPESACFYAYCKTETEANALATRIDTWVNNRRGNSTPQPGPDPLIAADDQGDLDRVDLNTIIGRQGRSRVVHFEPGPDSLLIIEACDEYFGHALTAPELDRLITWLQERRSYLADG